MRRYFFSPMLLAMVFQVQCQCSSQTVDDSGIVDADRIDSGSDADLDVGQESDGNCDCPDADLVIVGDADPDVDNLGLCRDVGEPWTWHPEGCPEYTQPRDCCASCRQLICQDMDSARDIWGDWVVYEAEASVGIVDLSTGESRTVFRRVINEDPPGGFGYLDPVISSRYVVAWRQEYVSISGEILIRESVVARSLHDLSGPEIILDASLEQHITSIDVYDEWVVWSRRLTPAGDKERIVQNIETGEQRIILRDPHNTTTIPAIWGDRVVWGANGNLLREYRISTEETRTAYSASPEMQPIGSVRIWGHRVIYNPQPSGRGTWDIILVNIDTSEARWVTPPDSNQDQPSIHNGRIVWTDFREAGSHTGMHVYIYSLSTGREYVLNPSGRAGSEPLIFNQNLVWNGVSADNVGGIWVTQIGNI